MNTNTRRACLTAMTALVMGLAASTALAVERASILVTIERPVAKEATTGVGVVYGWAVAPAGIDRLELYVDKAPDGSPNQVLAYGDSREDVCQSLARDYPERDYPDCSKESPGFASTFNYNLLSNGPHEFFVRAYDVNGDYNDARVTFQTHDLGAPFISDSAELSLPAFRIDGVRKANAAAPDERFDLEFQWSRGAQQFVMGRVTPNASPAPDAPYGPNHLLLTTNGDKVHLSWRDGTRDGMPRNEDWFIVERKYSNPGINVEDGYEVVGVNPSGVTTFTDDTVRLTVPIPGVYTYRVKSANPAATKAGSTASVSQERLDLLAR